MPSPRPFRNAPLLAVLAASLLAALASPRDLTPQAVPAGPTQEYRAWVGAESADLIHRVLFGPDGLTVEKTLTVGELPTEMEGPHGLAISRDGRYLHMTTGHGLPDGKYWRYELGPDTLAGPGAFLGMFPASLDVTPDGLYAFVVNFNLHGDMVPSTVSVVFTPTHTEVARVVTCVMPHGSRVDPSGLFQYSACMMDDQLVEIDTRSFEVSRRFSVAQGAEGPVPATTPMAGHDAHDDPAPARPSGPTLDPATVGYLGERHRMEPSTCSPTWAQPTVDGRSVLVACNKSDEILEVEREGWTLERRFETGRGPYNLAVTPDGRLLLATLKQGSMLEVFELASGRSLTRLPTSTTLAHGVVVSPDSRYAFVTSEGVGAEPGKVDVYDLEALAHVGSVDVGQQASGIAFWKMGELEGGGR